MKLSIIIPVYNIESYIGRCIESVYKQGLNTFDFEVVIINDGTKDNSAAVAEYYQKHYKNLTIHTQENMGLAAARNKGLTLARGKYIYFLDGDDYLIPNGLSQIVDAMEENALDLLGFKTLKTTSFEESHQEASQISIAPNNVISGLTFITNNPYRNEAWWYMIKKEYVLKLGISFPVGRKFEDSIFTHQLLLNTSRFAYADVAIHRYFQHPKSIRNTKQPEVYRKIIGDLVTVALDYVKVLEKLSEARIDHIIKKKCTQRVRGRQQSLVFFMLVRFLKSDLSLDYLSVVLPKLKQANAYPMDMFLKDTFEYRGIQYKVLGAILNSKVGLHLSFFLFRTAQKLRR